VGVAEALLVSPLSVVAGPGSVDVVELSDEIHCDGMRGIGLSAVGFGEPLPMSVSVERVGPLSLDVVLGTMVELGVCFAVHSTGVNGVMATTDPLPFVTGTIMGMLGFFGLGTLPPGVMSWVPFLVFGVVPFFPPLALHQYDVNTLHSDSAFAGAGSSVPRGSSGMPVSVGNGGHTVLPFSTIEDVQQMVMGLGLLVPMMV
jgi:hypothetical protein